MKFKDIASLNVNSANNQSSLNLKSKQLKRMGITPEQILELTIPKSKINIEIKKGVFIKDGKSKRFNCKRT